MFRRLFQRLKDKKAIPESLPELELPKHFALHETGLREGIYHLCWEPLYFPSANICLSTQTYFGVLFLQRMNLLCSCN